MRLTYETGIAAFIQFIIVSLFILVTQLGSSAVGCFTDHNDCVTNLITSILFFIVTAIAFGVIWLIGYAAQDRRSRRLAQLLICIEGVVWLGALFSLKLNAHSRSVAGLIASFGMLIMATWTITLAFRLMRSGGGRVVAHGRRRRNSSITYDKKN